MLQKYQRVPQLPEVSSSINLIIADSYCWRDDLINRYESLWSLFHKFASLNFIGAYDLRAIFGSATTADNNSFWRWNNRADLRYLNGIDLKKLICILNINEQNVKDSVVETFVKPKEIKSLSSEMLRFCSKCLKEGFHSPFHQMLFFTHCPAHQNKLSTKCPNCSHETPYKLDKTALLKAFGCPSCKMSFCPRLLKRGTKFPLVNNIESKFDSIYTLLRKRSETEILEASVDVENIHNTIKKKSQKTLSQLVDFWIEVFGESKDQFNLYSGNQFHVKVRFNIPREERDFCGLINCSWDIELYSIYKSIGRHLVRTHLSGHLRCIEIIRQSFLLNKEIEIEFSKICVGAGAYVLWRMFYDGVNKPAGIFRKNKGKNWHGRSSQDLFWHWLNHKYSRPKIKRIFALECYWTFYECELIVKKIISLKRNPFDVRFIIGLLLPHWIITPFDVRQKNVELCEIHHWIEVNQFNQLQCTSAHDYLDHHQVSSFN